MKESKKQFYVFSLLDNIIEQQYHANHRIVQPHFSQSNTNDKKKNKEKYILWSEAHECRIGDRVCLHQLHCCSVPFSSVTKSCMTLCNLMVCSMPGFPVHHQLPELAQTHVYRVSDLIHPFCHPLLLLPSILPSIRVFSNESVLHIRWPKYWSFSFSISPSNEYSGLIAFRMDCLDLLAVQGTLKSPLQHHSSKASIFGAQLSL